MYKKHSDITHLIIYINKTPLPNVHSVVFQKERMRWINEKIQEGH